MDLRNPPPASSDSRGPLKVYAGLGLAVLAVFAIAAAFNTDRPARSSPARPQPLLAEAPSLPTDPEDRWIEWEAAQGPRQYRFTGFTVDVSATRREDLDAARIKVRTDQSVEAEVFGDGLIWGAAAKIAVVRLAAGASPTLLVSSFSGGAHCCSSIVALELHDGRWRRTDLGSWDGDTPPLPTDLDGDGVKEFRFLDQGFLYTFASYADSWAPPVIHRLVDGRVRDVSAQPSFRLIFRQSAENSRDACLARSNGACAAFVAASSRAGNLDAAWAVMLRSYDQTSGWTLPMACRVRSQEVCPAEAELTFATFPEALQWFLGDQGYMPKPYVEPLTAAGPSFSCGAATAPGERSVCQSEQLSRLDRTLAVAFTRAMALSPDRRALRQAQRTFLVQRNEASDPVELALLYEDRVQQLLAIDEPA